MMLAVRMLGRVSLAQSTAPFTVVVTDPRGSPFSGAKVTLQGQTVPVTTDQNGVAKFPSVTGGQAAVQVDVAGFTVKGSGPTDRTLFISVPVCADGPLLTKIELAALLLGAVATVGGLYTKHQTAAMLGEILVGSSIFSAVYRNSCRW